jgi:hypothetical protein
MAVLTLDTAKYPDGTSATPASGGSLADATTYYYRVAAVTAEGETCACGSFNGTTANPNLTLDLAWNAVHGVKATGGYIIYRNTSDLWASGSLELVAVNTNSYSDDGSASPSADQPHTFTSDNIKDEDFRRDYSVPEFIIPGQEGGQTQYHGRKPQEFPVRGFTVGTSAITDLERLRDIASGGVPVTVTIAAFGQTWISDTYFLKTITWSLDVATQTGGEILRWLLNFVEG